MTKEEKLYILGKYYRDYQNYIYLNESLKTMKDSGLDSILEQRKLECVKAYEEFESEYMELAETLKNYRFLRRKFSTIPPMETYQEIADSMGCSIGQTYKQINYELEKLEL